MAIHSAVRRHGGTCLSTALMIRNGVSEARAMRSVRLFCRAVNLKLRKELIKFPTTYADRLPLEFDHSKPISKVDFP